MKRKEKAAYQSHQIPNIHGKVSLQGQQRKSQHCDSCCRHIVPGRLFSVIKPMEKWNQDYVQCGDKGIFTGSGIFQSIGLKKITDK